MTKHVKPTKQELQASVDAAAQELETPPTPPVETPPASTPPEVPPAPPVETPPTPPVETPPAPASPAVDWKKKFSESSREAQVQGFKSKEIQRAVDAAATLPDPTEEDLKKEYGEWDDMTPTEQRLAKDNLLNKRRFEIVHEATEKFAQVDAWSEQVDTFVTDPKVLTAHPELEGKIEEFKQFASKPSRRGVDLEDLILAFSGEQAKTVQPPKTAAMFPTGSPGPNEPVKVDDGKISLADAAILQKTNYKKWKEMLLAGKIREE